MQKIIHVDMDCFYAAVEVKKNPALKGKPLGIGGPPDTRSVLCTASYEARKFGVKSAMPSSHAVRLCPQIILIPPDFDSYREESRKVREIFERFTDKIEPLSLDEAYLDVTDCNQFGGSATLIAHEIRRLIYTELNLTASAGIASNKFIAKIASDWKKPNGQFVVRPEEIPAFVEKLPVEKIFGVGKVTAQKMHDLGLRTCADIQKQSIDQLTHWFGSRADELYDFSRGIDTRPVQTHLERKSLTVETTFDKDLQTWDDCAAYIPALYQEWLGRIENGDHKEKIKSIVVKLKFFDFKGTTHEAAIQTFPKEEDFYRLLETAWDRRSSPVRLIGLGVHMGDRSQSRPRTTRSQLKFAM